MYQIRYHSHVVEHDLPLIDVSVRKRIFKAIERLARAPEVIGEPLRHDLKGFYKLRIGDWRVIYEVRHNELIILVVKVGHRREVYDR